MRQLGRHAQAAPAVTRRGGSAAVIGSSGCPLFTPDDAWNVDISGAAVDATQTSVVAAAVGTIKIHPDFGPGFGIPFNVVPSIAEGGAGHVRYLC